MSQVTQIPSQLAAPVWAGDFLDRDHLIPAGAMVDAYQFLAEDAVVVTTTANASSGAVTVAVAALSGPIPSGTILKFGAVFAELTAAAAKGAVSLSVTALAGAISSGATGTYTGMGKRRIPSGTAVGRTLAERDAGTPYGPAADTDDEFFLLAFDITDATRNPAGELYRHGSVVKENFLPGWANTPAGLKLKIRTAYTCILGGN